MSSGHKPALPPDVLALRDQQEIAELVQPAVAKRNVRQPHIGGSTTAPQHQPLVQQHGKTRKNYSLRMIEEERNEFAMILAQLRLQQRIRLPFNDFVILAIRAAKTRLQACLASKEPLTLKDVEREIQRP